jgi:ABC-2 type transport system permease protein
LPQFFLAGAFNPIRNLPWYLDIVSHISPLRYAVDLIRGAYYGYPNEAVLADPAWNVVVITVATVVMLSIGTFLFVRSERNR